MAVSILEVIRRPLHVRILLCETERQVHERKFIERHCNTIKHKKRINLLSNKDQPFELSSSPYSLSNKQSEFLQRYV